MWLKLLANWKVYALVAVVSSTALAVAYGAGYLKGSHKAELACESEKVESLVASHERQIEALTAKAWRENEANKIDYLPRPDIDLCDAGDDWLLTIQEALRLSGSIGGADAAASANGNP